jgi:hypothetical protein
MPFELARTLLVSGQMQRRAKRKRIARQHLDRALGIFESLPAPLWAERARSELSRIGLRPPAPLELTATGSWSRPQERAGSCMWTLQALHIEFDPAAHQTTRLLRYDKWQDGTLRMTELQMFRLQHWDVGKFEALLAEAGFTDIFVTSGYQNACPSRTRRSRLDLPRHRSALPRGLGPV